jgi:hypothetical protein
VASAPAVKVNSRPSGRSSLIMAVQPRS